MRRFLFVFNLTAFAISLPGCGGSHDDPGVGDEKRDASPSGLPALQEGESPTPRPSHATVEPSTSDPGERESKNEPRSPIVPPPDGEIERLEDFTFEGLRERMKSMKAHDVEGTADFGRGGRTAIYTESRRFTDANAGLTVITTNRRENVDKPTEKRSPLGKKMVQIVELSDETTLVFERTRPRYHGQFSASQRSGAWTLYYENGAVRVQGSYSDERHGGFVVYDENSRWSWRGRYEQGKLVHGENYSPVPVAEGQVAALEGHMNGIAQIVFSPDGKTLATSAYSSPATVLSSHVQVMPDSLVRLWDVESWQLRASVSSAGQVERIYFAPDSKTLLTAPWKGETITLWDAITGAKLIEFPHLAHFMPSRERPSPLPVTVAYSEDGGYLAALVPNEAASHLRDVRVWDARTGDELFTVAATEKNESSQAGNVARAYYCLAFSPDSAVLAVAANDGLHLFETTRGTRTRKFGDFLGKTCLIHFCSDGKSLLTRDVTRGYTQHWNLETGRPRWVGELPSAHRDEPHVYAYSPDGAALFELFVNRTAVEKVLTWDLFNDRRIYERDLKKDHASRVRFSTLLPGGDVWMGLTEDNQYELWSVATGEPFYEVADAETMGSRITFCPNGQFAASCDENGTSFRLLSLAGAGQRTVSLDDTVVTKLAFSADSRLLASGSADTVVRLWDVSRLTLGESASSNRPPTVAVKSISEDLVAGDVAEIVMEGTDPDGDAVRFQFRVGTDQRWHNDADGRFRVPVPRSASLALEARSVDARGGISQVVKAEVPVVDNPWLDWQEVQLLPHKPQTCQVTDVEHGKTSETRIGKNDVVPLPLIAFHPDGESLLGYGAWIFKVWNLSDDYPSLSFAANPPVSGIGAYSPDGQLFCCGTKKGTLHFWDTARWRIRWTREHHEGELFCVAFSPDGKAVASSGADETIRLWRTKDGKLLETWRGFPQAKRLQYSPDGAMLVALQAEAARLIDADDGTVLQTLGGQDISHAAFTPDGSLLVTLEPPALKASAWRTADGQLLCEIDAKSDNDFDSLPTDMAVHPDGTVLAFISLRGTITLRRLSDGRLLRTLVSDRLQESQGPYSIAFSPNGNRLASTCVDTRHESRRTSVTRLWGRGPTSPSSLAIEASSSRTWTDKTGRYQVEATYLSQDGEEVRLKKADGSLISVPFASLSEQDQDWIRRQSH